LILAARSAFRRSCAGTVLLNVTSLVLIVAPDRGFRRSLEFALEAEGFAVDSHALISTAVDSPQAAAAICSVVDEDALRDVTPEPEIFNRLAKPVILLADRFLPTPEQVGMTVLMKPLLGNALIASVRALVATPQS
jgi:hypothetical protein